MRKTQVVASVAMLALVVSSCGSESESEGGGESGLRSVDVGDVQLSIFAPLYVADAKGYFEDEGLEVNIENVQSGQEAIPLASSGQLDVVTAGFSAGMFSSVNTGLDISVVGSMGVAPAADEQEPPSSLVVSKELHDSGEIESIADLEGKSIGALGGTGGTAAFYIALALDEAGLSINDVELVQLSNADMPAALGNGSIDAAFASAPFWSLAVEDGSAVEMWTTPEGTSGTGVIYGGEFANSDQAQPFFNALARGAQDLQGDDRFTDENLEAIGAATDQTAEEVESVPLYTWHPDLRPLPEQLSAMEQVWMEVGALEYDTALSQDDYVDSTFAEDVDNSSN